MRSADFGFNTRTGYHDRRLTPAESAFLSILWDRHVGRGHKISADDLARAWAKRWAGETVFPGTRRLGRWKRWVRQMHNHLLRDHSNIPVLSKAGTDGGYWIAESEAESIEFYDTFRKRGLTGLVKASRGKQSATVDLVRQLAFNFDELVDQTGAGPIRPRAAAPMPVEVVDAFLDRMTRNPEKFADGLRKISRKYGSILMPKERLHMIRSRVSELEDLVASLGEAPE